MKARARSLRGVHQLRPPTHTHPQNFTTHTDTDSCRVTHGVGILGITASTWYCLFRLFKSLLFHARRTVECSQDGKHGLHICLHKIEDRYGRCEDSVNHLTSRPAQPVGKIYGEGHIWTRWRARWKCPR